MTTKTIDVGGWVLAAALAIMFGVWMWAATVGGSAEDFAPRPAYILPPAPVPGVEVPPVIEDWSADDPVPDLLSPPTEDEEAWLDLASEACAQLKGMAEPRLDPELGLLVMRSVADVGVPLEYAPCVLAAWCWESGHLYDPERICARASCDGGRARGILQQHWAPHAASCWDGEDLRESPVDAARCWAGHWTRVAEKEARRCGTRGKTKWLTAHARMAGGVQRYPGCREVSPHMKLCHQWQRQWVQQGRAWPPDVSG